MSVPALIGVDWGTSNFRAFLLDSAGTILDRRAGPHGILHVSDGRFAPVLAARIGEWLADGRLPILMSGMIGSRQGWIEAPYVETPAGADDLARALAVVPFDAADVRVVAGLKTGGNGMPDVIRGEETQIVGALARLGLKDGRFLLPGTHSKWATVAGGRVVDFVTYMTGEIFSTTRDHTILGRLMQPAVPGDDAGFLRGVADGARDGKPGALLSRLFGVRTLGLFGMLQPEQLQGYLSGLLIGAEIADHAARDAQPVRIIASDALAESYRLAAASLGIDAETLPSDCIADGYVTLARMAGLIAS